MSAEETEEGKREREREIKKMKIKLKLNHNNFSRWNDILLSERGTSKYTYLSYINAYIIIYDFTDNPINPLSYSYIPFPSPPLPPFYKQKEIFQMRCDISRLALFNQICRGELFFQGDSL